MKEVRPSRVTDLPKAETSKQQTRRETNKHRVNTAQPIKSTTTILNSQQPIFLNLLSYASLTWYETNARPDFFRRRGRGRLQP